MFVGRICSVDTYSVNGEDCLIVRMFGRSCATDKPRFETFSFSGNLAKKRLAELANVDNAKYCYAFDAHTVAGFEHHWWGRISACWHIDNPFLVEIKNGKAKVYL